VYKTNFSNLFYKQNTNMSYYFFLNYFSLNSTEWLLLKRFLSANSNRLYLINDSNGIEEKNSSFSTRFFVTSSIKTIFSNLNITAISELSRNLLDNLNLHKLTEECIFLSGNSYHLVGCHFPTSLTKFSCLSNLSIVFFKNFSFLFVHLFTYICYYHMVFSINSYNIRLIHNLTIYL